MTNFSPNMLKTYQACPKKYFYKFVEQINVPMSFLRFEKGKKIHALANYYMKKVNISRIETALTEEEQKVWQALLNNPYFQKKCYKSEYQLVYRLGDFWIGGRLDAVVYDDNGYYILDYKTGSVPKTPEFDCQTMIYLLCLKEQLPQISNLSFVYIDLKNTKNHVIEFNENLQKQYEEKLYSHCTKITEDNEFLCDTKSCKFCEYQNICPQENDFDMF